jgi:UDP-N-acetyl-D-mannosaminuronic acid dehydrogenase
MSTIYVHGLGYIGLPTAAMFANYGHDVTGYDTDEAIIDGLEDGYVHVEEPGLRAFVTQALESGNLTVSNDVGEAKNHIIAVPTPFDDEAKEPGLEYVEAAGEAIAPHLRTGDTVILESTVPPGTTVETLQPALEQSGLDAGADFALVHCPETVLPGNIITELKQNDRIIGGVNGVSTEAAVRLYKSFVEGEIYTTENATTAEFVKLIQNTYRDVNIALANELALIGEDYDIDSREAIEMANTHPRVEIHQPGPGVGGHCLPIDPWFLGHGSDQLDLISTARAINDGMSGHVIDLLRDELETLDGQQIALLGVAYKGNVGDTRQSPALDLAAELQQAVKQPAATADGAVPSGDAAIDIGLHDPHVDDQILDLVGFDEAVAGADAVVITTDHDEFTELDPSRIRELMAGDLIVDTKGLLSKREWRPEGFSLRRI